MTDEGDSSEGEGMERKGEAREEKMWGKGEECGAPGKRTLDGIYM